ncbi:MAG: DUF1275 domain-containing protein [Clostridiaceae bacterium]|nr:DUF1275 domain-containing protein [Clostridiaceae bacterium]
MGLKKKLYIAHTLWLGIPLAIVGGYLDAYTYFYHGGVFANAQTGNMVFLGLSLARGAFSSALSYLIPIVAFAAGVFLTERMRKKKSAFWFFQWRHIVLAVEALLLFVIGLLPNTIPDNVVNVVVSFICAMQVNSFAKLHNSAYATTMCTGNLKSATQALADSIYGYDAESFPIFLRYVAVLLAFCAGAALGAVMTKVLAARSAWFCTVVLLGCIVLLYSDRSSNPVGRPEKEGR